MLWPGEGGRESACVQDKAHDSSFIFFCLFLPKSMLKYQTSCARFLLLSMTVDGADDLVVCVKSLDVL